MFGMGFMEILLIAVIAIIALGPDKLPTAMVEIAKFIKKFKTGVEDAKSTLDSELNISQMKEEAHNFKAQIENTKDSLSMESNLDLGLDKLMDDDKPSSKEKNLEEPKTEEIETKKKKKKKKNTEIKENIEVKENTGSNKFKVKFDDKKEDNA